MMLKDAYSHVPALAGAAAERYILELAGLHHEYCKGVIATTNDDQ